MKTKILLLIIMLVSIHAIGQEVNDSTAMNEPTRKNVLKFLPENLIFNSLSFEYERKFSPKSSFILGVGLASPKSFAEKFNLSSADNQISKDEFSTMSVRVAYRHYSGHHIRPVGFYFSPYLKYQKFSATADNYRRNSDVNPPVYYNETYDVNGNTLNIGLQSGVQFLIAKRVCIDIYLFGFEAGLANVTATVKSSDVKMMDKVESGVRDNVNQLPSYLAKKITITRNGTDQIDLKGSSIPYPWLRSGISMGIAF